MKKNLTLLTLACLFGLVACIDEFDPKLQGGKPKIVFEGTLTNLPGPYFFQLSYSAGYNSKESVFDKFVNAAKVWITDGESRVDLTDLNKGQFSTPENFRGKIGKTYQLHIQLSDGTTYESEPEKMKMTPPIEKIYSEFKLTTTPFPKYRGNFNIYVDVKDPDSQGDYYRWKWVHYERASYCSQYTVTGDRPTIVYQKCCTDCWNATSCLGCIVLASDNLINGNMLKRQLIGQIPFDNITGYYMLIEQMSLSRNAYNFWRNVAQQSNNSGGIFDIAPASIRGNLKNINDNSDVILGYFQVSAVEQKAVYIQRNNTGILPFGLSFSGSNFNYDANCEICKESQYRTAKRPLNWVD
ncbi:hypothetical protein Emtol_3322 [Emticicia oligotrophica DSM 17448]|uniref:DUF4249 domain-containing protein n=1 Tax=Emticicia oligotrophica (strain DSM 17448 / CIP 109782 / MTCC 6937 / GPTSA100-15) TaxID=929562 RepID=A0ABM5N4N4_EMTOG|nr:DUF4249 domain-containing protein [Emticicia oligotrophica]AFK04451.1 hypothetical protein Emtol_3322 [Emticicia oligotrophica DSM 17448]